MDAFGASPNDYPTDEELGIVRDHARRRCDVHPSEVLVQTNPADVENGPSPLDADNDLICFECQSEEEIAFMTSECLAHRKPIDRCLPCMYEDEMVAR
jgi:hypothetical protein